MPSFFDLTSSVSTAFTNTTQKISSGLTRSGSSGDVGPARGPHWKNVSGGIGNLQGNAGASIVSMRDILIHSSIIFFSFLCMCCFANTAAFQATYGVGPSGLSAFALFLSLLSLVLSAALLGVPLIYDRNGSLKEPALFLKVPRSEFVLFAIGLLSTSILSLSTTISAFSQPGCKDPALDPSVTTFPSEEDRDAFVAGLPSWCRTKRAGAIFAWPSMVGWGAFLVWAVLAWRRNKGRGGGGGGGEIRPKHERFEPPVTEDFENTSYETPKYYQAGRGSDDEEEEEERGPFGNRYQTKGGEDDEEEEERQPRASNTYGAFDGRVPEGYGDGGSGYSGYGGGGQQQQQQQKRYGASASDPFDDVRAQLSSSTALPAGLPPPSSQTPHPYLPQPNPHPHPYQAQQPNPYPHHLTPAPPTQPHQHQHQPAYPGLPHHHHHSDTLPYQLPPPVNTGGGGHHQLYSGQAPPYNLPYQPSPVAGQHPGYGR